MGRLQRWLSPHASFSDWTFGNTVIKAVLFDLEGRQVSGCAIDGESTTPEPGHVERDLEELWRNASEAIRHCISDSAVDPTQIAATGCAGHGNGLYLLDRERQVADRNPVTRTRAPWRWPRN